MALTSRTSPVPAHLLMVDDNKMGLQARKVVMEEVGYKVTICISPVEALERATRDKFDLIITDFRMPTMDGVELIGRLRKAKVEVPIILISGFAETLGLDQNSTGADAVIQKSANEISHLLRSVKSLLRRAALKKPPGSQGGPGSSKRRKA